MRTYSVVRVLNVDPKMPSLDRYFVMLYRNSWTYIALSVTIRKLPGSLIDKRICSTICYTASIIKLVMM